MADKKISQLTAATLPLAGTELLPIVQSGTTDNITVSNLAAGNIKSNATTGVLQVTGPAAASTRVMTTPNANFTVARTDAGQTFTGTQLMSGILGVGTSSPAGSFTVSNSGAYGIEFDVTNQFVTSYDRTANAWSRLYFRASEYTFNLSGSNNALTVSNAGNVTVGSGNLVIGTSGKGIDFSATAGTGTSELLADYEEGTWTPVLTFNTPGDLSVAYSTQVGTYTKVGNVVTVSFNVITSTFTWTTAASFLKMTGLPYTVGANDQGCGLGTYAGITRANYTQVGVRTLAAQTFAIFNHSGSGQTTANIVAGTSVFSGTNVVLFGQITYTV